MKKIVTLGNTTSTVRALEEIRKKDAQSEVIIVSLDSEWPYQPFLFGDYLAKEIPEHEIFYKPAEFFKENNIQIVSDKKIVRVDFKKRRLLAEDKTEFPFDVLLVSDVPFRFQDIKGVHKTGVFYPYRFKSLREVSSILPLVETVVIEADNLQGLKLAWGVRKRGKEVIFITSSKYILSDMLDEDSAGILADCLERGGVRVLTENSIIEILGNGDAKAVRLKTGKVIAAEAIFLGKVQNDFRIFEDSSLEIREGICGDEFLRTNIDGVYALAPIRQSKAEPFDDEIDSRFCLEEQGRVVGLNVTGEPTIYTPPLRIVSFKIFDLPMTLIGKTKSEVGWAVYSQCEATTQMYKKILTYEGYLAGAVLMNAEAEKEKIKRLIEDRVHISSLQEDMLSGTWDYQKIIKGKEEGKPLPASGDLEIAWEITENPHQEQNP